MADAREMYSPDANCSTGSCSKKSTRPQGAHQAHNHDGRQQREGRREKRRATNNLPPPHAQHPAMRHVKPTATRHQGTLTVLNGVWAVAAAASAADAVTVSWKPA